MPPRMGCALATPAFLRPSIKLGEWRHGLKDRPTERLTARLKGLQGVVDDDDLLALGADGDDFDGATDQFADASDVALGVLG
jgi:hypothetical protein